MMVLTVAMGGILSSVIQSSAVKATTRETVLAATEAQSMLDALRVGTLEDTFALYNENQLDDPGGIGTAPGAGFEVAGLSARVGDPDGLVGRIIFPSVGGQLREDSTDGTLGMPRDLNGDGVIDVLDHALDYVVLPVRIRIEWAGRNGQRSIEFMTSLSGI